MGKLVHYFGTAVWICGILMIIGNVTRIFPTFPFAGYLTTVVGVLIQGAANRSAGGDRSTYLLNCGHCGTVLEAKRSRAGQQTTCGNCNQPIVLPPPTS